MPGEPAIQLENVPVRDHDDMAIGNEILNGLRAQDLITIHLGVKSKCQKGVQLGLPVLEDAMELKCLLQQNGDRKERHEEQDKERLG